MIKFLVTAPGHLDASFETISDANAYARRLRSVGADPLIEAKPRRSETCP